MQISVFYLLPDKLKNHQYLKMYSSTEKNTFKHRSINRFSSVSSTMVNICKDTQTNNDYVKNKKT